MAAALSRGDGAEYAQLLRGARLVVPQLPEPGTEAESQLAELFPPDLAFVPVFTSPETLGWVFGDLVQAYHEVDFAVLLQRWPDRDHQLWVNPGSPIAVSLPPQAMTDLAEGRQSLVPVEEVRRVLSDEAAGQLRRICLSELAGGAGSGVASEAPLRDDPPTNQVEVALREAVHRSDGQAYLHALLAGDPVHLLTASPVTDPADVLDDGFPWRVLGGEQVRIIPVFSSQAMMERTGAGADTHIEVDLLHALANWPSEEHLLYVNPGSQLELLLPGEMVLEIVASLADALERQG